MDLLASGTCFVPGPEIVAPGEAPRTPILLEAGIGELPHGYLYTGHQGDARLQLTAYRSELVADPEVREALEQGLRSAAKRSHPTLLPLLGILPHEGSLLAVRMHPERAPIRRHLERRQQRGERFDVATSTGVAAQLCGMLTALHPHVVHGYLTPDTVYLGADGGVVVGACGEGIVLPYALGFDRFRAAGLLTMAAPEVLESRPRHLPATDIYGVAALVVEMLSGRPLAGPGCSLAAYGLDAPDELLAVLERALAPAPEERWASASELGAYLGQWAQRPRSLTPVSAVTGMPLPPPPAHGGLPAPDRPPRPSALPPPRPAGSAPHAPSSPPPRATPGAPPPPPAQGPRAGRRPPRPPPPPPEAPSPGVSAAAWSALDQATRRVLDTDAPPEALTDGVGEDLGLGLDRFDDAADRLSTLDGESGLIGLTALDGGGAAPDPAQRAQLASYAAGASGQGYFGSLATADDPHVLAARPVRPPDRDRASFVVTRDGVDQVPRSLVQLEALARAGELRSTDRVRDEQGATVLAVDLPGLRPVFERIALGAGAGAEEAGDPGHPDAVSDLRTLLPDHVRGMARPAPRPLPGGPPVGPGVARGPGMSPVERPRGLGTLAWIVLAALFFGVAAWVLWQRNGGSWPG